MTVRAPHVSRLFALCLTAVGLAAVAAGCRGSDSSTHVEDVAFASRNQQVEDFASRSRRFEDCCKHQLGPGRYRDECIDEARHGRCRLDCRPPRDAGAPRDAGSPDRPSGSTDAGSSDTGSDGPSSAPTCAASPTTVWGAPQPSPSNITSIWSIARNDVLAFGAQLSRWDGTSWSAFSPQPPFQNVPAFQGQVTASGDDDIWLQQFGFVDTFPVTRWNGTSWLDVSPTFPSGTRWTTIWLSGPNEAWLAVQLPTPVMPDLTEIPQPALYHWTGSAWTKTPSPVDSMAGAGVGPMWSSSPSDVWAIVGDTTYGAIHWDGRTWTTAAETFSGSVFNMWGSSATDIWAGGWSNNDAGVMWHFDGRSWSELDFGFSGQFRSLWGSCSGDFWATSEDQMGSPPVLWHYDGSGWSTAGLVPGLITGTSPDDIWMTGPNSGMIRHRQPGFCGDGVIGVGEQCDPPVQGPNGLQCGSNCQLLTCGNGVIDPGEQCDPPKSSGAAPLCSQTCQIPTCGNGAIDPGETCDPPDGIVCDSNCQSIPIVCGNDIVQPGEQCDGTPFCNQCQETTCGECFFEALADAGLGGEPACSSVTGTARTNCLNLLSCLTLDLAVCFFRSGAFGCFCDPTTCPSAPNGQCTLQFEAVAGTTDPAVVVQQLADPTSLVSRAFAEGRAFADFPGCGELCISE